MLDLVFLTKESGLLLGPISAILGIIMNAIYEFLALFSKDGIANIALCIILFTVIVKMLMLPLTIKQQKSSKLTARMTPELNEIREKYKGKNDEASQRRMQLESQAVYEKYGTNPMAGCLPLLISLPIMIALYRVIYAIPAYINDVGEMYRNIAEAIQAYDPSGYAQTLATFINDAGIKTISLSKFGEFKEGVLTVEHIIDVLSKCTADNWVALEGAFPGIAAQIAEQSADIIRVNKFLGGLNILNNPVSNGNYFSIGVLIPVLAVVTQIIQTKLMTVNNDQMNKNQDDAMAASMKSMNIVMPLMSGFICFMIPIGVGIYWIISSVVQIVQQIFINRYMDKVDVEEMIEKNQAKMAKRREKMGIATGSKMAEVAKTSTKGIENKPKTTADFANLGKKNYDAQGSDGNNEEKSNSDNNSDGSSQVSGSGISAYANIMKNRNQK